MYYFDVPAVPRNIKPTGNFFVPAEWDEELKRPRGIEFKNEVFSIQDATPSKNVIYLTSKRMIPLRELAFFLIWRYQKTYTRALFESMYGKMFAALQEYLDSKRPSLNGVPGLFSGIPFGDKVYKFKQQYHVHQSVPVQFQGANLVVGLSVDRVQAANGSELKSPKELARAYKELKTIFGQEIDYMGRNPALKKQPPQSSAPQK